MILLELITRCKRMHITAAYAEPGKNKQIYVELI